MSDDFVKTEREVKSALKKAISNFCRWRVNNAICNEDDCEFCPVNDTFSLCESSDEYPDDGYDTEDDDNGDNDGDDSAGCDGLPDLKSFIDLYPKL